MKFPLYSIRDVHVGFGAPTLNHNDFTAKRDFIEMINTQQVMKFAVKDFDLYKIAEFDSETGKIENLSAPELIMSGTNAEVKE